MIKIFKGNKLLQVLSLNSVSVLISFFLGIFSAKIIAVFMGVSGMALLGNFRNFTTMFKSLATIGMNNSIIKLVVENKENKAKLSTIYSTFFWVFLLISVILAVVIFMFSGYISSFLFSTDLYIYPICFFAFFLPLAVLNVFWLAIYNGLEAFKKIIFIQIFSNIFIFGLTAILIWKKSSYGGLLAIAFSELVLVLITFLFVRKEKDYFKFELKKIIDKECLQSIANFSSMALLSAIVVPFTLIFIRKIIISSYSIQEAGMWDAVNKLSGFYMMIISSGLSLYYMPKLASLKTDLAFKKELKVYFTFFVPLFIILMVAVFIFKDILIKIAFTSDFLKISDVVIWQILGDFFRIMTLAFGYQILVKSMIRKYFIVEILFNFLYLILSFYLVKTFSFEGALQAYFLANFILFIIVLLMFRNIFITTENASIS